MRSNIYPASFDSETHRNLESVMERTKTVLQGRTALCFYRQHHAEKENGSKEKSGFEI